MEDTKVDRAPIEARFDLGGIVCLRKLGAAGDHNPSVYGPRGPKSLGLRATRLLLLGLVLGKEPTR